MRYVVVVAALVLSIGIGPVAVGSAASSTSVSPFAVASVSPSEGAVVGVAHPVDVTFAAPVADRFAAEQTVSISTSSNVTGQFSWLDATTLRFTPDGLWPAHSPVSVEADGFATNFETGSKVVGVADLSAYNFTVSIDDEVVRQMPASMGKSGFATPIGSFTALEKQRNVVFDSRTIGIPLSSSEGYLIDGEYAVRVTWGGVYVHSAPWSVGAQGVANVSHGCINLSPDNAAWYFDTVSVGDPIIVQA